MDTRKRSSDRRGRLGRYLLTALAACALLVTVASAATVNDPNPIADPAAPKPQVTVQGNVVVDKSGKPTGFYELALCIRTARTVTLKDGGATVPEADYAAALAQALEKGDRTELDAKYDVVNYPFQSASAAVHIDPSILTAVTWNTGKLTYASWDGVNEQYGQADAGYPRGLDMTLEENLTDGDFEELTAALARLATSGGAPVALRTAKPDEVSNATVLVEKFLAADDALVTLTANTATHAGATPVIYEIPTPVVVVRFSYDMARFDQLMVGDPDDPTNAPNQSDFWAGLDKNDRGSDLSDPGALGRHPLTFLGARDPSPTATDLYGASDGQAADSSVHQTAWYLQAAGSDGGEDAAQFYYYMGAERFQEGEAGPYTVYDPAGPTLVPMMLTPPKTAGSVVVAKQGHAYPTAPGDDKDYSFFQNLLSVKERTLRVVLVNAETYRKPTGGVGGAMILFYDWDDALIGALAVDPEGDARAEVNRYVEEKLVHPDLRTSALINSAKDLAALQAGDPDTYEKYNNLVSSLAREYTYRGDYAYKVGYDNDDDLKFPATADDPGEDYPLTNKLDYAFYRRRTAQTEVTDGDGLTTRYYSAASVSVDPTDPNDPDAEEYDGYRYPYVNGWAIVEDESQDISSKNWILRKDSVKTEDVWTTFGVGELASLKPAAVAGTVPGDNTPYSYAVTQKDAAWYLRFADFSAMENMLAPGQDVLIVKAVYEPGDSLLKDDHYTVVDGSLRVERYSYAASTEASVYSFQYQYRRASQIYGPWQGVGRTRSPAVKTEYTYDVNAFDTEDQDLDPTVDTRAFVMQTISNNDDILNIDLTTGGVLWKVDYTLVDIHDLNISSGLTRSAGGELNLKNNFLYEEGVVYPERQGTDGFVLEATLNTLLAEATKGAREETNRLSTHFALATILDLNLRADMEGTAFGWGNYTRAATYLQDLVTRLYNTNDPQYRDPKTGNVTLTWHQIQRHILTCMQAGGAVDGIFVGNTTLMSDEACAGFSWCRLDDCGLTITVNISDLGDIFVALDKAKSETGDKHPAKDALDKLMSDTPSLLDGYLNQFRKDEDGRKFKNRTEMMDALKAVYNVLSGAGLDQDAMKAITPAQVQEIIITGKYPTTGKTYWWWNNGKRPVSTWQDFIEAGMLVVTGDVPDALDGMTNTNLPTAVTDMIGFAAPKGSPANVGWFRAKDIEDEDNGFADVEEFKAAWLSALRALRTNYDLPKDWNTIPWIEIQYALLTGGYKPESDLLKTTNYWWKDGGLPKLTFEKLLAAADAWRQSGYTDSAELDRLLAKGVNPVNNEVYLRRTAAGTGFTSLTQFKSALKSAMQMFNFASNGSDYYDLLNNKLRPGAGGEGYQIDIYQFQYLLINAAKLNAKPIPDPADIKDGTAPIASNYWWIEPPHVPTEAQNITSIIDLITYAYWVKDGVETEGGTTTVDFALDKLDADVMTRLKLRAEEHGMPFTTETPAQLRQLVVDAITEGKSGWPYTVDNFAAQTEADLTRQLQNILLGNPFSASPGPYWWQTTKGFVAETHETLAQAAWLATVGFGGKTAPDAMDGITDLNFITRRETIDAPGMAMRSTADGTAYASINAFKTALTGAIKAAADAGTMSYADLGTMTNYQLQYLLLNNQFKSDAAVKAEVIVDGVDAYWWFTADKPPDTSKKEPVEFDDAEWSDFLDSAMAYYKKATGVPSGFVYELTDEKIKDVLRLRKGPNDSDTITKAELFNKEMTDLVWAVLDALNTSSRKDDFIKTSRNQRSWVNKPTWAEFQYVLLHLNYVGSGGEMPSTADCEAAKEGYSWMWTTAGAAEYERIPMDDTEWSDFLDSAMAYYKKATGVSSGFVYELTDEKIKDVLRLRKGPNDSDTITTTELFNKEMTDLVWAVLDALNTSSRKDDFIKTSRNQRSWVNKPTWAEFQYVLLNLNYVGSGGEMLSTADCEAWATRDNTSWAWQEKAAGASLLAIEPPEVGPEDEPIPLSRFSPDETPPERADKDSPGEQPVTEEKPETPMGDEVLVDMPVTRDNQGGYAA